MIALMRICLIIYIYEFMSYRFLPGNIILNEKYSISTQSLEIVIDILKDKFNIVVTYLDLILNK